MKTKPSKKAFRILLLCLHIGFTIAFSLLFSVIAGIWLDKVFKTKMIFTFIFTLFGVYSSFKSLWNLAKE